MLTLVGWSPYGTAAPCCNATGPFTKGRTAWRILLPPKSLVYDLDLDVRGLRAAALLAEHLAAQ